MKFTPKMMARLFSSLALLFVRPTIASEGVDSNLGENDVHDEMINSLIDSKVLVINSGSNGVFIDNQRLLNILAKDFQKKIADPDINNSDKEVYQNLLKNLSPGSFTRRSNGSKGLQSMDFSKGN